MDSHVGIHGTIWIKTVLVVSLIVLISGCLGAGIQRTRTGDTGAGDTFEVALHQGPAGDPDNCTKCHFAWAEKFEYYRGWDRYGYIFDDRSVIGYYDPWLYPDVKNMYQEYYATEWWNTGDQDVWPYDIAHKAESMSVLSRPGGLPAIPKSLGDITGTVIVVAKSGGDYKTIKKAVKKAKSGTTVFVREGEYNEAVTLKNGVSLIGGNPYNHQSEKHRSRDQGREQFHHRRIHTHRHGDCL
jgi:hypothetical protein